MLTDYARLYLDADFWNKFCKHHFLPFAKRSRWFAGKIRCLRTVTIRDRIECSICASYLLIINVDYEDESELYFVLVTLLPLKIHDIPENAVIIEMIQLNGKDFVLIDGIYDESFRRALFYHFSTATSDTCLSTIRFHDIDEPYQFSKVLSIDSTHSLIVFNAKYLFKIYRKLSANMNREIEMLRFMKESENFIPNVYNCWSIVTSLIDGPLPQHVLIEKATKLGRRTAEMHLSLYKPNCSNVDFASEIFTDDYCRFITQHLIEHLERCFVQLQTCSSPWLKTALHSKTLLLNFISNFETRSFQSYRIRVHGDFHLGQVLFDPSNDDYTIIDFEGEPSNDTIERHLKHSPMKDVAGMIRSFHYAAALTYNSWFECVREAFLHSFLKHSSSLWMDTCEPDDLLLFHLLERTIHELGYEMNYRPQWIDIPLRGLIEILDMIKKRQ